jgi:glycosyltransferase involved in cell wall biosynthesis
MMASRGPATIAVDARLIGASGIGTYLRELLPRMAAARPELSFAFLGPSSVLDGLPWTDTSNVRIIHLDVSIYSAQEQIVLPWSIPAGTDLLWSPHYNIPLAWRGRLAVTVHDLAHLALPEFVGGVHRRAYSRFMFRQVSRRANAIITVSDFTATEFDRLVGCRGVKPEVVHSGVDRGWFEIPPSASPHARPYLIYVGNVKPHKNLGRLLEAFRQVASRIQCDLLILGKNEGFLSGDRTVRATAERLAPRVQLLGALPQEELMRYVSHAEALVLPSLYEGFGLPPLEAMACGCPAIVSNVASLPEVCGDAAEYFNPFEPASIAEAILRVQKEPGLRETLQCRGLERARRFTWESSAGRTLTILERALAG